MKKYIYIFGLVSFLVLASCSKDEPKPPVNPVTAVKPVATFKADLTTITAGAKVTFTDTSTNSPTSWAWTFEGGTPPTSTEKSPVVTYATAGNYKVSLVAGNAAGNSELTETANYIKVNPDPLSIIFPKTIKRINSTNKIITSVTFAYDDKNSNKIKSITIVDDNVGNIKNVFTYTDDKITKVESYDSDTNELSTITTLFYKDNKQDYKTVVSVSGDTDVYRYSYNADGTVVVTKLKNKNGKEKEIYHNIYTLDTRGNMVKNTEKDGVVSMICEYDTGNNPLKNILGYSSLEVEQDLGILDFFSTGMEISTGINNQKSFTSRTMSKGVLINTNVITFDNTLDPKTNFLIKSVKKYHPTSDSDTDDYTDQFSTFEYTYYGL